MGSFLGAKRTVNILTPPDRIRLKKDDILIEGQRGRWAGGWGGEIVRLFKRAGQGERRGAEHGWPHMRTVGAGGWQMVKDGLMRI